MNKIHIKRAIALFAFFTIQTNNSLASNSNRPDHHAPIGVMRDHVHKKGELMTSIRAGLMKMKGLRNGNKRIATGRALQNYMVTPTSMTTQMYMAGLMYGVTNKLTLSGMGSYIKKDMDHQNRMTGFFNRKSDGVGDTKINASYQFYQNNNNRMQLNLGVSLPTGSIDQKYNGSNLPYKMQIGSGSYELLPGVSYSGYQNSFSYGTQLNGTFRLDKNSNGYKLGDNYNITAWVAKKLNNSFSLSTRLDYNKNEAIEGLDSTLSPLMIATADASLQDGERLDFLFGTNFIVTSGFFKNNRLAFEFGLPVYQRIDGPNLGVDYKIMIGWQKTL